jgi:hypothetical protein
MTAPVHANCCETGDFGTAGDQRSGGLKQFDRMMLLV